MIVQVYLQFRNYDLLPRCANVDVRSAKLMPTGNKLFNPPILVPVGDEIKSFLEYCFALAAVTPARFCAPNVPNKFMSPPPPPELLFATNAAAAAASFLSKSGFRSC